MSRLVVVASVIIALGGGCLTTYNRYKLTPLTDAPAVEPRPAGCNVDVVEDGQKINKKILKLGHIVLEWPRDKIAEQGPDGAIKTLTAAACENGAFALLDMRALPTADQGLVYEADLATLVGDDGKPVNPKIEKPKESPPPAPVASGW